jgi:hypothetical protein
VLCAYVFCAHCVHLWCVCVRIRDWFVCLFVCLFVCWLVGLLVGLLVCWVHGEVSCAGESMQRGESLNTASTSGG